MADRAFPDALPTDYRLHWYVLARVLGQGGFGITYLARDTNLDQMVAIKEFLPVDMATRLPDASVRCRTDELRERYRWGLERFIQEARTLAKFDHRNIVRVLSVFEANDTAYMVMRFEEGHNLASQLERRGTLPEPELQRILLAILDGLELVHNAGFIHRDIKPDNIHIRSDGTPVLLDFGSARHSIGKARTMTILVAPGYAPLEQYYSDAESQGPWTDIYGLAATCYRAIAGVAPIDAIARSKGILGSADDVLVPASVIGRGRYSERLLAAIDRGLAFAEKDRPQSIAEWRREIVGEPAVNTVAPARERSPAASAPPAAPTGVSAPSQTAPQSPPRRQFPLAPFAWSVVGAVVATVSIAVLLGVRPPGPDPGGAPRGIDAVEVPKKDGEPGRSNGQQKIAPDSTGGPAVSEKLTDTSNEPAVSPSPKPGGTEPDSTRPPKLAGSTSPRSAPEKSASPPQPPRGESPRDKQASPKAGPPQAIGPQPAPAPAPKTEPEPPPIVPPEPKTAEPQPTPAEQWAEAEKRGDYEAAVKMLLALAEKGNVRAQTRLAHYYSLGRGVARDDASAVHWFRKAAEKGDGEAQLNLGHHYVQGRGVPQDFKQAYIWYSLAARAGISAAEEPRRKALVQLQPAEIAQADGVIRAQTR